jgi:hypothetical protein
MLYFIALADCAAGDVLPNELVVLQREERDADVMGGGVF